MKIRINLVAAAVLLLAASWVMAQDTTTSGTAAGQTGSQSGSTSMGQAGTTGNTGTMGQTGTSSTQTGTMGQTGAAGQTSTPGTENGAAGMQQGATSPSGGAGLTGCLSGLPVQGIYTLKDQQTGKSYRLTGNIEHLGPLVGNEVQITGQPTSMPAATSMGSSSNPAVAAEQQAESNLAGAYQVTSANKVADNCLQGGQTGTTSSGTSAGASSTTGTSGTTTGTTANTGTTGTTQPQNTQPGTTTPGTATPSSTAPGTQPETTPSTQPPPHSH